MPSTKSAIAAVLATILQNEGGYQDHRGDRGNYNSANELIGTNYGISAPALERHLGRKPTRKDMKTLSVETAKEIYKEDYIQPVIEKFGITPDHPAFEQVVDMTVNHGLRNTAVMLQRVAGATVDGIPGPKTRAAIQEVNAKRFNNQLVNERLNFYGNIARNDPKQTVFVPGWIKRAETFRQETAQEFAERMQNNRWRG